MAATAIPPKPAMASASASPSRAKPSNWAPWLHQVQGAAIHVPRVVLAVLAALVVPAERLVPAELVVPAERLVVPAERPAATRPRLRYEKTPGLRLFLEARLAFLRSSASSEALKKPAFRQLLDSFSLNTLPPRPVYRQRAAKSRLLLCRSDMD